MKQSNLPPYFKTAKNNTVDNATEKTQTSQSNNTSNPLAQTQRKLLNQSIHQRQAYKAMESSAANPIQNHAKQRGKMLERRIEQLQRDSGQKP